MPDFKKKVQNVTDFSELLGNRVFVTGASGFIGSHLCHRLIQIGSEVHGMSRSPQSTDDSSVHWWQGDTADFSTVRQVLSTVKPDVIFHLASHVTGGRDLEFVLPTFHSNLATTVNLLVESTEIGCKRIVLVGSQEEPEPHDNFPTPSSPYAAAKWACSGYARMFHALYETPVVVARVFMVYGPGQQDLSKLIPYVTLSLLRNEPPKLTSGKRDVDWIYVQDVVEGLLFMAQVTGIEGSTIDIGTGSFVSIRKVVEQLADIVGSKIQPLFGAVPDRPMEQIRVADIDKTYAAIGWKPSTPLERGLKNTVDWYRAKLR